MKWNVDCAKFYNIFKCGSKTELLGVKVRRTGKDERFIYRKEEEHVIRRV